MLARLKHWAAQVAAAPEDHSQAADDAALRAATALLLVEAASLDGHVDPEEEDMIRSLLAAHFDITAAEAERLLADARTRQRDTVDLYGMTRTIKDRLVPEDRTRIMEMIWQVAYADGELHDFEASLARRVAGLLYVSDHDSGTARKRALQRLEQTGKPA